MKITKLLITVIILVISAKFTFAQNNFTGYLMPSATVKYELNKKISQSFGIENRNFVYDDNEADLRLKHLEFAHFTKLEFKEDHQFGFGLSYRFESEEEKENELRLMQQYEWKKEKQSLIKHRIRTEQRIYSSLTKYRFRYQTKVTFPTKVFFDEVSVTNELALEVASTIKPDYEERIGIFAKWDLSKYSQLEIGPQYRLSNFTQTASHNLFLSAALNFEI
jgi:hypothetical protein